MPEVNFAAISLSKKAQRKIQKTAGTIQPEKCFVRGEVLVLTYRTNGRKISLEIEPKSWARRG